MQLLTVAQVADLLQVSERTVMRHARGLGGFYPVGIKVLRFRVEDVERACSGPGGALSRKVKPGQDDGRHGL